MWKWTSPAEEKRELQEIVKVFENISVFWTWNYSIEQTCIKYTPVWDILALGLSVICLLVSPHTYLLIYQGSKQKNPRLLNLTWRVELELGNQNTTILFTACYRRPCFKPLTLRLGWPFIHLLGQLPLHNRSILPFFLLDIAGNAFNVY